MTRGERGGESRRVEVPADRHGDRLDRVLTDALGITRSRIRRLVDEGHVLVDGRRRKASYAVSAGSVVEIELPEPAPSHIEPEDLNLAVLYEDDALIVVDKPAGLVVHPGAGVRRGTLVNGLVHHCPSIRGVGGVARPGLVHRLDRGTSGLIVAAKVHEAYLGLVAALKARTLVRRYRAIAWGHLEREGIVDAPIGRDRHHRTRMAVRTDVGKPAITHYRTIQWFDFVSDVELTLETGRTHQIRVHLASEGRPVFGDPTYGGRSTQLQKVSGPARREGRRLLSRMTRQALHAWSLTFEHPLTNEHVHVEAPLPADFSALVAALGESGAIADDRANTDRGAGVHGGSNEDQA